MQSSRSLILMDGFRVEVNEVFFFRPVPVFLAVYVLVFGLQMVLGILSGFVRRYIGCYIE